MANNNLHSIPCSLGQLSFALSHQQNAVLQQPLPLFALHLSRKNLHLLHWERRRLINGMNLSRPSKSKQCEFGITVLPLLIFKRDIRSQNVTVLCSPFHIWMSWTMIKYKALNLIAARINEVTHQNLHDSSFGKKRKGRKSTTFLLYIRQLKKWRQVHPHLGILAYLVKFTWLHELCIIPSLSLTHMLLYLQDLQCSQNYRHLSLSVTIFRCVRLILHFLYPKHWFILFSFFKKVQSYFFFYTILNKINLEKKTAKVYLRVKIFLVDGRLYFTIA